MNYTGNKVVELGWIDFPKYINSIGAKTHILPEVGVVGDGLRSVQGISVPITCKHTVFSNELNSMCCKSTL